jgi:hypothetical protein
MIIEINDATLLAALDGDEAATEQLAVYAEKRLRPLGTELATRFLECGRLDRPELLRTTLGEIPVVLEGRPETLDELVHELASHLLVNAGEMRRWQAVGEGGGVGARLRLVCPPR